MKILVSFSGGKDSQACLIQAFKQYGGGNLTAVFCDTGWEHPDTYKHVNDVCLQMGVRLITLKSKYDFVSLAAHKKRFPSTNARFCTSELKMKPMIDYVLSLKESCIIIQGIRAGRWICLHESVSWTMRVNKNGMNIMIRDPYYLAKTVLGSYNLYILKDPFGSWHYSCVGTFNTKDEAIDYYHKLKEEEKMISRMHMKLIITE